ncbi:MAG: 50S ribosomal protein L11 methyltransferase [Sphingobacteriales bacterium]|nr:MAG: 50S ribosomal protein L11 methyltransferase [Sphingobacteriales bacterium]
MIYKEATISGVDDPTLEIIMAMLAEREYEGFNEEAGQLKAFIPETDYSEDVLRDIAGMFNATYSVKDIPKTNWNKEWESNFDPVVVEGVCTIRAHFHDITVSTPYEIIITPKMSFGTGHHATTQLMMTAMQHLPVQGARLFDFGTGTGILAILAVMMGAGQVQAIDNDEWSVINATENAERNGVSVELQQGSLEDVTDSGFDIILANINRHILLQYMKALYDKLAPGGQVLMSGLLLEDETVITNAAKDAGFLKLQQENLNGWISLLFCKDKAAI